MGGDHKDAGANLTVLRALNNNVIVTRGPDGRERILVGRGIGFGASENTGVDPARIEKTFVLADGPEADHARELLSRVPFAVIRAVTGAVDVAERMLSRDLGRRITLAVIDHVAFVLQRVAEGVRIPATSMPEVRVLYPDEYAAATQMAAFLAATLEVDMPTEEAFFLTMHLLNATRDEPNGSAALLFRRVQHVVKVVESELGVRLNESGADYARFILHVKFLLQRLVSRTMLRGGDSTFFDFASTRYPRAYMIAERVKGYVLASTGTELTDEELLYLIVHVERLATRLEEDHPESVR